MNPEVDSYSGFYDNSSNLGPAESTGLFEFLVRKGIEETYIVGLALDFCVGWTAQDSHVKGFKTNIVLDATKSINNYNAESLSNSEIKIINSKEL